MSDIGFKGETMTFLPGNAFIFLTTTASPMTTPALILIRQSNRIMPFPSSEGTSGKYLATVLLKTHVRSNIFYN